MGRLLNNAAESPPRDQRACYAVSRPRKPNFGLFRASAPSRVFHSRPVRILVGATHGGTALGCAIGTEGAMALYIVRISWSRLAWGRTSVSLSPDRFSGLTIAPEAARHRTQDSE